MSQCMTKPANLQNDLCAQQRLRSAWASAVFAVCMKKLGSLASRWVHCEDWSDWVDAQADLSLRWAHRSFCWFCHVEARFQTRSYYSESLQDMHAIRAELVISFFILKEKKCQLKACNMNILVTLLKQSLYYYECHPINRENLFTIHMCIKFAFQKYYLSVSYLVAHTTQHLKFRPDWWPLVA